MALACKYMRIIESWGSGIPRIDEALVAEGRKPLDIEDNGIDLQLIVWRKTRTTQETTQETAISPATGQKTTQETTQESFPTQEERSLSLGCGGARESAGGADVCIPAYEPGRYLHGRA
ncbi:MAG: hypothetical protein ACI4QT_10955 [Kiritimatiellia bacterium]